MRAAVWLAVGLVACRGGGHDGDVSGGSRPGAAVVDPEAERVGDAFETALKPQFEALKAPTRYSVATAPGYTAEAFSDGLEREARQLFELDTCLPFKATPSGRAGPWTIHRTGSRGLLDGQVWYASPANFRGRPVLVISDGASGAARLAGEKEARYPGEAVARALYEAGHPVLVMALKGFEEPEMPAAWGIPGPDYYAALLKARGLDRQTEWVRDAHDALCLLRSLQPAPRFGVVGVSKSGVLAALAALFHPDVDSVYLASGFSRFEETYSLNYGWAYAPGERLRFTRNAVLLALFDRRVRLSYSEADHPFYAEEAVQGLVLESLVAVLTAWNVPLLRLTQHTHGYGHYFDLRDVEAFFAPAAQTPP